jgi:hypothetical protein
MLTYAKQMAGGVNAILVVAALTRGLKNNWARTAKTQENKNAM